MLALAFGEKSSLQLFHELIFRIIRKKLHVLLLKDTFQTWNDQSLEGNYKIIFSSLSFSVEAKPSVNEVQCPKSYQGVYFTFHQQE